VENLHANVSRGSWFRKSVKKLLKRFKKGLSKKKLYICTPKIETKNFNKGMYLTPELKKQIFVEFGGSETNTGSTEAQVALLTYRINHLTEHQRNNKKDLVTRRSLVLMVGRRRRFLEYLRRKDINRYRELIKKLGIRK
jgi:small subunit ribosomal protein S15